MIGLIDLLAMRHVPLGVYKVHLATITADGDSPLRAYFRGEFKEWQENQSKRNFPCETVVSLIAMNEPDRWLFAGAYRILSEEARPDGRIWYTTDLLPGQEDLVGYVVIRHQRRGRQPYRWGHAIADKLGVCELREKRLEVEDFPGFHAVVISHDTLKTVVARQEVSWKSTLSCVTGIYLIMDTKTGKPYVGSATGEGGLWQRWCSYATSGHGGNQELITLLKSKGSDYAANFQFSVLEIADSHATDEQLRARETYWKDVLVSRVFGYNSN